MVQCLAHYHQWGAIQQLMDAGTESHSQTLGRARKTIKKRRKDSKNQHGQVQKPKEQDLKNQIRVHMRFQRLKWQTWTLYGSVLGFPHTPCGSVTYMFCGTPSRGSRGCLWLLLAFFLFFIASFSLDMRTSLIVTCYHMFGWQDRKICSLYEGTWKRSGLMERGGERRNWEEWRREKLQSGSNVYEKNKNK